MGPNKSLLDKPWQYSHHFLPSLEEQAPASQLKDDSPVEQSPRQASLDQLTASPSQTHEHAWLRPEDLPADLQMCELSKCAATEVWGDL